MCFLSRTYFCSFSFLYALPYAIYTNNSSEQLHHLLRVGEKICFIHMIDFNVKRTTLGLVTILFFFFISFFLFFSIQLSSFIWILIISSVGYYPSGILDAEVIHVFFLLEIISNE